MIRKKSDGTFSLPSINKTITPPDMVKHKAAKSMKADPEDMPFRGVIGEGLGLRKIQGRIDQLAGRDSMAQRAGLRASYDGLVKELMRADMLVIPRLLKACRDLKPAAARAELKENLPATLATLRDRLCAVTQAHHDARVRPAREALAAALSPEVPSDPGQAATLAISRMEIRQRLMGMDPGDRVKIVAESADRGDFTLLEAVRSDPFGAASMGIPADLLAASERRALDSVGAGFLAEAVEDAEAENATLVALAGTLYGGLQTELADVEAPAELTQTPRDFQGFAPKN